MLRHDLSGDVVGTEEFPHHLLTLTEIDDVGVYSSRREGRR